MSYSKYRAKPQCRDGIRFASKKEADRYVQLKMLEKAGEIRLLRLQEPYFLSVSDGSKEIPIGKYIADFTYYENGKLIIEDVKGMKTQLYKWKSKHFFIQFGIKIRET